MKPDFEVGRYESIMQMLEVFDDVTTYGAGTVLYSRRWRSTALPRNLQAAMAATGLGITSLDHARRTYVPEESAVVEEPAVDAYLAAYLSARDYIRETRLRLHATARSREHIGTFAAAIALQRLESGFRAAHLLYRLGLNVEGDAVARQILEQIAWSLAAAALDDLGAIDRVSASKSIGVLKRVLPDAGKLYGRLSDVAHAGIAQHRELVMLGADDAARIVMARPRLAESAEIILELADAWVVVCERTQLDQLEHVRALNSIEDPTPNPDREFRGRIEALAAAIRAADKT